MGILSLLRGKAGGVVYLTCVECGEPRRGAKQQKRPICAKCYKAKRETVKDGKKRCARCGVTKSISEFHKNKTKKDGLSVQCSSCVNEKTAIWAKENRSRKLESMKSWRETHRDDVARVNREYGPVWYEKNKERLSEHRHKKYEENKERYLARNKAYRQTHPEVTRSCERNHRAKKKANGGTVTRADWREVLEKYGSCCLRCGSAEFIQQDHVVAIANGGVHHKSNLQPLCRSCNASKGAKTADYRPDKGASWVK